MFVKGIIKNGIVLLTEKIDERENQPVIITFLEAEKADEDDWDKLIKLIEDCSVDTGIDDLAHQHDYYLYRTTNGL